MPIGIFDSGIGGLTVFKEINNSFPETNLFYLGDTARVPYGNKSSQTVIRYSLEAGNYLYSLGIDALVIACNTASSYALDVLKREFDIPVIGVVEPGVELALRITKNRKIGVIGTQGTIRSGSYQKSLLEKADVEVYSKACPLFVPLVEEGMLEGSITEMIIKEYLDEIVKKGIDTLILGCTHYPLLKKSIKKLYPDIQIVDSSQAITEYLKKHHIPVKEESIKKIFITDESPAFENLKKILIGNIPVEKLEISQLCTL